MRSRLRGSMTTRETLRRRAALFHVEVVDRMTALATAAFGLVAALAWNTAIQELFKRAFPTPAGPSLWPLLGYAAFVTVIAVLVIIWIGRVSARLKQEAQERLEEERASARAEA